MTIIHSTPIIKDGKLQDSVTTTYTMTKDEMIEKFGYEVVFESLARIWPLSEKPTNRRMLIKLPKK